MPATEPPPESGLVWLVDEAGHHWTYWVSTADGAALASQPIEGPLWADDDTLWQWALEPVEVPVFGERPSSERPDPAEASGHSPVYRGVLRELVSDASVTILPAPEPGAVREVRHAVRLDGSVGTYLFVNEELTVDSWGAHPSTEARARAWDLRAAAPAELLTERERASLLPDAREQARTRLSSDGREPGGENLRSEEVELVALRPRWELDRGLSVALHFTTAVCYACGDGAFGDYTRSVWVDTPALPELLGSHGALPDWARIAAERIEGATLLGYTVVSTPGPADILASLRR